MSVCFNVSGHRSVGRSVRWSVHLSDRPSVTYVRVPLYAHFITTKYLEVSGRRYNICSVAIQYCDDPGHDLFAELSLKGLLVFCKANVVRTSTIKGDISQF